MPKRLLTLIAPWLFVLCAPALAAEHSADVVLVVHGSAITDPSRQQTLEAVIETTAEGLGGNSRLGLFEFDADTHQQSPLEPVSDGLGRKLLTALLIASERKNGQLNPATALEKAIYQLRTEGRDQASRIVIMLSDGVTASGDKTQDGSLRQWMRDGLSSEAEAAGIRIYWLTLSEAADYQTIQRVTQKTGGKYFRAFAPASARASVLNIFTGIAIPANAKTDDVGMSGDSPASQGIDGALLTLVRTHGGMIALGTGGVLALLIVVFRVRSGRRKRTRAEAPMMGRRAEDKRVVLRDMSEFTAMTEYDITERRTYIGRLPREVTERSCVIVIRDTSVGRDHAGIEYRDNGYWLSDHGTVNGTYVNGKRLQGTRKLMAGDRIRFARFEFKIHIPAALAAAYERRELDHREQADTVTQHDDDRTVFRSHRH